MSTIFALASAAGRAGIAVIRVSGPSTTNVLQKLSIKGSKLIKEPRKLFRCDLLDKRGKLS